MHPYVHSSTIRNIQNVETIYMSIERCTDKGDVVHVYNGILLSHNKEQNNAMCSNMMQLEIIPLNEVSERERQVPYDVIYIWSLKYATNELLNEAQTDSQT